MLYHLVATASERTTEREKENLICEWNIDYKDVDVCMEVDDNILQLFMQKLFPFPSIQAQIVCVWEREKEEKCSLNEFMNVEWKTLNLIQLRNYEHVI